MHWDLARRGWRRRGSGVRGNQKAPRGSVLDQEVHRLRLIRNASAIADQLQRHVLARFRRDQEIRLSSLFGDGLDIDVLRLSLIMLGLELARTAQNDGRHLLWHPNGRLKLRPKMQDRDLLRVDRDRGDARSNRCVRCAEAQWNQECDGDEPGKLHGVDLLSGLMAAYLRIMNCRRT